jgi:hypothetical protein
MGRLYGESRLKWKRLDPSVNIASRQLFERRLSLSRGSAVCQQTDSDLPLPKAAATVNITSDSQPEAPIHVFGTGDAYAKPISNGRIMLWMEENNLQFQNVSGKDISSAVLNIVMTDHRGNQFLRNLESTRAGVVFRVAGLTRWPHTHFRFPRADETGRLRPETIRHAYD